MKHSITVRTVCFVFILLTTLLSSCKKDMFNEELVESTYTDKFPVKNIDPLQDWKTTRQVAVDVSVYEDRGEVYTVRVYDQDPLGEEAVHLLATGYCSEGLTGNSQSFQTQITVPIPLDTLCIGRSDAVGRTVYRYVPIVNGTATAEFGEKPSATRTAARSIATRAVAGLEHAPYSDEQINEMLAIAVEYTGQDMDAAYAANGTSVFKISTNSNTSFILNHAGTSTPTAGTLKLIVAPGAIVHHGDNQNVNSGLDIIVASGATMNIKNGSLSQPSFTFLGTSRFIVMGTGYQDGSTNASTSGSVYGQGCIIFRNEGEINYNAGVLAIQVVNNNGGTFYNYGTLSADVITDVSASGSGDAMESTIVNFGSLEADKMTGVNLEVACTMTVNGDISTNSIIIDDNSSLVINGTLTASNTLTMGVNSILKSSSSSTGFYNCEVTGPITGYALISVGAIKTFSTGGYINNNVYVEYADKNTGKVIKNYMNKGGTGKATSAKVGNAAFYVTASDCTTANVPTPEPDPVATELTTYTYVFEDNFPLVGDYDFNDVVLDVTIDYVRNSSNYITATKLNVTLAALGASKTLGFGLRVVGIDPSLLSVSYGGDAARFRNTLANSLFETSNTETGNQYLTLPLAGNGHAIFDNVEAGTIVNTGAYNGVTAKTYSMEITLTQSQQNSTTPLITKDNLDFFIGYQYWSMEKRMEVHLYEFWGYGATAKGTIQKANLDVAKNNTWAVCVPNFRYPKEFVNISNTTDSSNSAYDTFLSWAQDRETNRDWYLHPNEENVYR
jgi:LruC domain-containing protein